MGKCFNVEYIYIVISDVSKVKFREKSHMNAVQWECKLTQLLKRIIYQVLSIILNIHPFTPKLFLQFN